MKTWLCVIILTLAAAVFSLKMQRDRIAKELSTAMANIKAYDSKLSNAEEKNMALQLTMNQVESYKDSILKELNNVRKELKIKSKDVKTLQYVYSTFTKRDSIIFRDTIFKSSTLDIDTTMKDDWYSVRMNLKYPSRIDIQPEFVSKKYIVVSTKKETINPPKKFWLFRLFQKKHRVVNVDVIEKNPYVNEESTRFIEVLK